MSEAQERMKRLEESSNKELLERAWAEITALCSGGKQWLMTVPVDADRDSDVLFGEVLKRFAQLEAENERLKELLRTIRQDFTFVEEDEWQCRFCDAYGLKRGALVEHRPDCPVTLVDTLKDGG